MVIAMGVLLSCIQVMYLVQAVCQGVPALAHGGEEGEVVDVGMLVLVMRPHHRAVPLALQTQAPNAHQTQSFIALRQAVQESNDFGIRFHLSLCQLFTLQGCQ
jgi:hypothetical protein